MIEASLMKIMRRLSVFCDGAGRGDAENTHLTGRGRTSPKMLDQSSSTEKEMIMWTKPAYTEMRFGFEVTMYIANR
jgi:pyrroloquinoline quinone biosynthesis protein A